jgi:hypothetical protein
VPFYDIKEDHGKGVTMGGKLKEREVTATPDPGQYYLP